MEFEFDFEDIAAPEVKPGGAPETEYEAPKFDFRRDTALEKDAKKRILEVLLAERSQHKCLEDYGKIPTGDTSEYSRGWVNDNYIPSTYCNRLNKEKVSHIRTVSLDIISSAHGFIIDEEKVQRKHGWFSRTNAGGYVKRRKVPRIVNFKVDKTRAYQSQVWSASLKLQNTAVVVPGAKIHERTALSKLVMTRGNVLDAVPLPTEEDVAKLMKLARREEVTGYLTEGGGFYAIAPGLFKRIGSERVWAWDLIPTVFLTDGAQFVDSPTASSSLYYWSMFVNNTDCGVVYKRGLDLVNIMKYCAPVQLLRTSLYGLFLNCLWDDGCPVNYLQVVSTMIDLFEINAIYGNYPGDLIVWMNRRGISLVGPAVRANGDPTLDIKLVATADANPFTNCLDWAWNPQNNDVTSVRKSIGIILGIEKPVVVMTLVLKWASYHDEASVYDIAVTICDQPMIWVKRKSPGNKGVSCKELKNTTMMFASLAYYLAVRNYNFALDGAAQTFCVSNISGVIKDHRTRGPAGERVLNWYRHGIFMADADGKMFDPEDWARPDFSEPEPAEDFHFFGAPAGGAEKDDAKDDGMSDEDVPVPPSPCYSADPVYDREAPPMDVRDPLAWTTDYPVSYECWIRDILEPEKWADARTKIFEGKFNPANYLAWRNERFANM